MDIGPVGTLHHLQGLGRFRRPWRGAFSELIDAMVVKQRVESSVLPAEAIARRTRLFRGQKMELHSGLGGSLWAGNPGTAPGGETRPGSLCGRFDVPLAAAERQAMKSEPVS